MEKFDVLLQKLNALNIQQKEMDWTECLPDEIWDNHFADNFKQLKTGLYPQTHRWYETSVSVISIYGRILGIRHITNLFSETSTCEDCCVTIEFFEMKEVQVVSYVKLIDF